MCVVLRVSRSGYYAWKSRAPSIRHQDDAQIIPVIRQVYTASRGRYGSPRVYCELQQRGVKCGRARVARLMRQLRLRGCAARRRKPKMPQADRSSLTNYLQRDFTTGTIDRAWAADMTYIRTAEGWLFLAVVLDIGTRRVIGWAMSARPDTELVMRALDMAIAKRQTCRGVIHHSDRGIHYTNARYRALLEEHGLTSSYSGLGNCWDNAVVESFFHTLKTEEARGARYRSRKEAKKYLFEYIEIWYNRKRRHSALDHLTPTEFEHRLTSSVH